MDSRSMDGVRQEQKNWGVASFAVMLGGALYLPVAGGQLYVLDCLSLVLAPALVTKFRGSVLYPRLFCSFTFWALAQVIVDVARHAAPADTLRQVANISLAGLGLLVVALFARKSGTIVPTLAGYSVGAILSTIFQPSTFVAADPWKYGLAAPVTILLTLLVAKSAKSMAAPFICVFASLAAFSALEGFRSFAAIMALTLIVVFGRSSVRKISSARLLGAVVLLLIAVGVIGAGYEHFALSGKLGDAAYAKATAQSGELGPIVGGRKEILFSTAAIQEHPILGSGSSAEMSPSQKLAVVEEFRRLGYQWTPVDSAIYLRDSTIPTHSALTAGWVSAGIIGATPWLLILWLVVHWYRNANRAEVGYVYPIVALLAVLQVWNVLFSPFGGATRVLTAVSLVAMVESLQGRDNRSSLRERQRVLRRPEGRIDDVHPA